TLAAPQAGKTCGRPQFPRENLLPACPVGRRREARLRCPGGVRSTFEKQNLAPGAQQFLQGAEVFRAGASLERAVDRRATARDVACLAVGFCQCGEERSISQCESRLCKLVEPLAQSVQPGDDVTRLYVQHTVETAPGGLPQRQRLPCRVIKQHRHIAPGRRQITYEQGYRAATLAERIAQGRRMIKGLSILDIAPDDTHRLIGK